MKFVLSNLHICSYFCNANHDLKKTMHADKQNKIFMAFGSETVLETEIFLFIHDTKKRGTITRVWQNGIEKYISPVKGPSMFKIKQWELNSYLYPKHCKN